MKTDFLSSCRSRVVVCDGAMGTQLLQRGFKPGECAMLWNNERSADVMAVYAAYVNAGCRLITTNSFGGTRSMLDRHGLGDHVIQLNRMAAALAREAAGSDGWVFGDVGPFGDFLEPVGDMTKEQVFEIFSEQIGALAGGGANAILIETLSDTAEAAIAIRASKSVCDLPVAATFAFQKAGGTFRTMMGATSTDAIEAALDAGADIVGANCGTDLSLDDYLALAVELKAASGDAPVILQPNAGSPKTSSGGIYYDATPEEMASTALKLREAGISIIGGCCGTSPAHLTAMAAALA